MSTMLADELPTKELKEAARKFKRGYTIESVRGGAHFRVRNPQGDLVQWRGKNLTLNKNARQNDAMEAALQGAGVFKGAKLPRRQSKEQQQLRLAGIEKMRATQHRLTIERRDKSRELRDRMAPWMKTIGADVPGVTWDLARYLHQTSNGVFPKPEAATHAIRHVMEGAGITDEPRAAIDQLSRRFEADPEPLALYIEIARQARGIDVETTSGKEWPFTMKLV